MKVVLASGNAGKLKELGSLLEPLGIELIAQREAGVQPAPETASTFIENAIAKARHASHGTGLPAIADDSGLVVRALGGAPGIYSARYASAAASLPAIADDSSRAVRALGGAPGVRSAHYAGPHGDDDANNRKLIAALSGVADRRAHFYCALVYLEHAEDPAPVLATGEWHGAIIDDARGKHGFGYDPHFLLPDLRLTSAELEPAQKNALSHRGQAARALLAALGSR